MNNRSLAILLCLVASIYGNPGFSQEVLTGSLYSIVIGSEGMTTEPQIKTLAPDAEKHLARISALLPQAFNIHHNRTEILPLSRFQSSVVLQQIAESCSLIDSTDLFVSVVCGAWQVDTVHPDRSYLLSGDRGWLTADYCVNLVDLVSAGAALLFIASPDEFRFPAKLLGKEGSRFESNGKYVAVLHPLNTMEYDELLNKFEDVLSKLHDTWKAGEFGGKNVNLVDALNRIVKLLRGAGVSISVCPIAPVGNPRRSIPGAGGP